MGDVAKGTIAMILACTVWGLSPLYYKMLAHIPPPEILSHRVIWSFAIFFLYQLVRGRVSRFWDVISRAKSLILVVIASLMISINWFLFIWSVQVDRVVETSLGYFIQPLVAVAFGVWLFSERLARMQWAAIGLAAVAVFVLTIGLGVLPWLSLVLAVTFGFYGVIKKRLTVGAMSSVTAEAAVLAPLGVIWLFGVHLAGWGGSSGAFGASVSDSLLLAFSGVMTAGPLTLMSFAAQRLPLATVGVLQYINPSLQFVCAVVIFAEPFSSLHAVTFGLIWLALAIYSWAEFARR